VTVQVRSGEDLRQRDDLFDYGPHPDDNAGFDDCVTKRYARVQYQRTRDRCAAERRLYATRYVFTGRCPTVCIVDAPSSLHHLPTRNDDHELYQWWRVESDTGSELFRAGKRHTWPKRDSPRTGGRWPRAEQIPSSLVRWFSEPKRTGSRGPRVSEFRPFPKPKKKIHSAKKNMHRGP
jgi:hypothetical protein